MNKAIILGRLTRDVEMRSTQSGVSVASFTVAVDRRFKDADGNRQADFINCVAWRNTADFLAKYFAKGSQITVEGSIQTRMYEDKNGQKRYATEINVEQVYFAGGKKTESAGRQPNADELFGEDLQAFEPFEGELPF